MSCNSCGLGQYGFGRRRNSANAAKAMRIKHAEGISLRNAWAKVKGKRSKRRGSRKRVSRKRVSRKRMPRDSLSMMRRSSRGKRRSRRGFGIVAGPGYNAQTSYSNAFAPYFGASEPFVNPSEWYLPQANGQIQSPQMLMSSPMGGYSGPGN